MPASSRESSSEVSRDDRIDRPRRPAPPSSPPDDPPALRRPRCARRGRGDEPPRLPRDPRRGGGRPSRRDAHPALRPRRALPLPRDDRGLRLHLPDLGQAPAPGQLPRPGAPLRGTVADPLRADGTGEDAPRGRHRLPGDPERRDGALPRGEHARPRALGGLAQGPARRGDGAVPARGRPRRRRGRLPRCAARRRERALPGREPALLEEAPHDLHDEQAARGVGRGAPRRRPRGGDHRPRPRARPLPRTARRVLPDAPSAPRAGRTHVPGRRGGLGRCGQAGVWEGRGPTDSPRAFHTPSAVHISRARPCGGLRPPQGLRRTPP